jgi:hypothetical protein
MSWTYEPPAPPVPGSPWVDVLRWLVIVMDCNGYLAFVAGCLAYAIDHDGCLTEKQAAACHKILLRTLKAWGHGALACQLARDHPLKDVIPEGHA